MTSTLENSSLCFCRPRRQSAEAYFGGYYPAATTASCRPRLTEAALTDPHAIVFFATDGIVSTRPLNGLAPGAEKGRYRRPWRLEYREADSGLFVKPGVCTYGKVVCDETGARMIKPVTILRGGDTKKYGSDSRPTSGSLKTCSPPGPSQA
jgi:hypothetical protein